jgi:hypothetical protein
VRIPDSYWTVMSRPAVASQVPSGAILTAHIQLVWPVRVWRCWPVWGSQIRTVASPPAVASQVPSGAIATSQTPSGAIATAHTNAKQITGRGSWAGRPGGGEYWAAASIIGRNPTEQRASVPRSPGVGLGRRCRPIAGGWSRCASSGSGAPA